MASRFTELDCWQLSNELKLALYEIARRPAVVADFKYRDQLTDAAASAPRNIAEGFGRRTDPQFAQFLDVAGGSSMECQNHLRDAVDRGYITAEESERLIVLAKRAGGAVAGLIRHLRRRRR